MYEFIFHIFKDVDGQGNSVVTAQVFIGHKDADPAQGFKVKKNLLPCC